MCTYNFRARLSRNNFLQYIKVSLANKLCSRKNGVSYSGFHKIKNRWVFVTEDGAIEEGNISNTDTVLLEECRELESSILKKECINKEELKSIGKALLGFNTLKITATILGYVSGLFLSGKLREIGIKYNHLLLEGQSGSGKSSTVENVIVPILSMKNGVLNAGDCSPFALNRTSASSNFIPLILDEYKPAKIGKHKVDLISNVMRNVYDSHKSIRGVATLTKNREFQPKASVILAGEVGVEETANVERSLKVIFAVKNHSEENKGNLRILKEKAVLLNKLGRSLMKEGLAMEEKEIRGLYEALFTKVSGKNIKSDRVRNSITCCLLGIIVLRRVFKELELDFEETTGKKITEVVSAVKSAAFEDLLDNGSHSKTIIEDSLETMNRMAVNGELRKGIDYDTVVDGEGDFVLRLNYSSFYDRFIKYCKEYNVEHEVLPLSGYKKQLARMEYCKCYNKPTRFFVRGSYEKESKTFRAACILVEGLRKKGVEVEYLVDK